jgi:hypothetical protein
MSNTPPRSSAFKDGRKRERQKRSSSLSSSSSISPFLKRVDYRNHGGDKKVSNNLFSLVSRGVALGRFEEEEASDSLEREWISVSSFVQAGVMGDEDDFSPGALTSAFARAKDIASSQGVEDDEWVDDEDEFSPGALTSAFARAKDIASSQGVEDDEWVDDEDEFSKGAITSAFARAKDIASSQAFDDNNTKPDSPGDKSVKHRIIYMRKKIKATQRKSIRHDIASATERNESRASLTVTAAVIAQYRKEKDSENLLKKVASRYVKVRLNEYLIKVKLM